MRQSKILILVLLAFVSILSAQTVGFQDPEVYIMGVKTSDGKFTQFETDLEIAAPDPLILNRFYDGSWKISPQAYLILGNDQIAYTYEPFAGLLKYKNEKVEFSTGMVNTYAGEASGKTDLQNNRLTRKGSACEIVLGDGTKRTYKLHSEEKPLALFGSYPEAINPRIYRLESEQLPSGNIILYSYEDGNILSIEIKDPNEKRVHAWIRFSYQYDGDEITVKVETSDEKSIEYHFKGTELKKSEWISLHSCFL